MKLKTARQAFLRAAPGGGLFVLSGNLPDAHGKPRARVAVPSGFSGLPELRHE